MSAALDRMDADFLRELLRHGLLIDMGVDGVYGRSGLFEEVVERFSRLVAAFGEEDTAEVIRFPPAMSRPQFERSGYLKSFPQLAGTVHSFMGNDRDHAHLLDELACGHDWTHGQRATDTVLTPAACYPLYPAIARRGPLPAQGGLYDLYSYCFRHEPSLDPARMQFFRMREYVRIGTSDQVVAFRQLWLERGEALMRSLEVPVAIDVANDPFFGRAGKLLSNNQRDQKLKFELLIPIANEDNPTACLSFNYHQDHFGALWDLRCNDAVAHTACVGFGMERVALALFRHHGFDPQDWPRTVRRRLWGD
ncbi:MAG TPA: amino acid--[acyl-carrier-protein] ligase [Povalibacter sp.]|uniref:amino acid--[acyl-carrier-protein] ligase n=1 Tax=Povalibacter sp. TaxID=1962978 RepID=UPI002B927B96|nr:amino acid--[acyl-carrier-protein] ligase [Povalibacter sp.]HMN45925.1 amino acid--[acyl-carrier-protein] ligase [Povalibacter sp.]